jgi:Organic solute transporter Ostalpha
MILESTDLLHQTSSISYADIHIGLPNMIICVQMVPFSFLIRWAYSTKDYKLKSTGKLANESSEAGESGQLMSETNRQHSKNFQTSYQGGRFGLHAWATYLNPFDMAQDSMNLSKLLRPVHVRKQTLDSWPEPDQESSKLNDANDTTQESHSMSNYQPVPTSQPEWRPSEDTMQHPQPTAQYEQPGAHYEQPSQFNVNTGYGYSNTGYDYSNAENGQRFYS